MMDEPREKVAKPEDKTSADEKAGAKSSAKTDTEPELTKSEKRKMDVVKYQVIEDLFYDCYKNRKRIYRINFFRGVFFGLGTFLGGTVIVSIVVFLLAWLSSHLPIGTTLLDWLLNVLRG